MSRFVNWLAHPRLMFWIMPLLMLLLVGGTLAQREIGLYEAERLFFASLPMYMLLAILSAGLIAKLVVKSPFTRQSAGTVMTHLGALLLMLGGLLTALSSQEGYLSAAEGETTRLVSDYHTRELALLDADGKAVARYDFEALRAGVTMNSPLHPPLTIEKAYRNAIPAWREEDGGAEQGIAQLLDLAPQPLEKQDEANLAGLIVNVGKQRYLLFEPMQKRPQIEAHGRTFTLALRKVERALPFRVTLLDFEKITYPGSDTAREYQSLVQIDEGGGLVWQALIRMNEPLRVMGYTLYQSSFLQREDGQQISVLAVVKNKGRVFPYVACLVMALGMLWHLIMRRKAAA